jgi:hypothetical protein
MGAADPKPGDSPKAERKGGARQRAKRMPARQEHKLILEQAHRGLANSYNALPDKATEPQLRMLLQEAFGQLDRVVIKLTSFNYRRQRYCLKIKIPRAEVAVYASPDDLVPLTKASLDPALAIKGRT